MGAPTCTQSLSAKRERFIGPRFLKERIFEEMMAENSPNLMKNINIHIEEAQLTSSRLNEKKFTLRHNNQTV